MDPTSATSKLGGLASAAICMRRKLGCLPHLPPSRNPSSEDFLAGPIRLKGGPYACLCCSPPHPRPDAFSSIWASVSPATPSSSPEAKNPPNFPRTRRQAWRVGAGQEATEGVKERKPACPPRPLLPSCRPAPHWFPPLGPAVNHTRGWRTIAADRRLSPEGGRFKVRPHWAGQLGSGQRALCQGHRKPPRDGGGFPCFHVLNLF